MVGCAGQGKFAGQRPTFYHCAMQPTIYYLRCWLCHYKGWKAESAWLADLQWTVYPHKYSPISCRSSTGQGKFAGHKPTFYHCATQPTQYIRSISYVWHWIYRVMWKQTYLPWLQCWTTSLYLQTHTVLDHGTELQLFRCSPVRPTGHSKSAHCLQTIPTHDTKPTKCIKHCLPDKIK